MSQELRTMTIKKLVLWGLALEEKGEKEREIKAILCQHILHLFEDLKSSEFYLFFFHG